MKKDKERPEKMALFLRSIITISIIFAANIVRAQDPLIDMTWHVKAVDDHYDNKPKISADFYITPSGILRVEEKVMPYLSLGKAGHQYWIIQHRPRGSSGDWENGIPFKKDIEVKCSPDPRIDKKSLECVYKYETLPGIEKFVFRVLLIPKFYWTGTVNHTPEQILAVSVHFNYGTNIVGPKKSGLTVYEDVNFQGRSLVIKGDVPRLGQFGFNDGISSFRLAGGTWLFCEHYDYQGACFEASGDNTNLLRNNWNDKISSIRRVR